MAAPDALEASYLALLGPLQEGTRGARPADLLEREAELARRDYLTAFMDAVASADEADEGATRQLSSRLARHLLDYPPLVDDPVAGDLEAAAEGLATAGEGAAAVELGERILAVLRRLRDTRRLIPPLTGTRPSPRGADLPRLLEDWPDSAMGGARDPLLRARAEVAKARAGGRNARARAASALVDLVVATPWEPWHPWRLALLEQAAELAPDESPTFFQLARHRKAYGEMRAARAMCRRAVDLDPTAPEPLVLLAGLLEFSARPREALDAYQRVLRLEGRAEQPGAVRSRGKPRRAYRSGSGVFRRKEVALARALRAAWEGCARLHTSSGNWEKALEAMVQVVNHIPGDTRQLRALYGLAERSGAAQARARLATELELRGAEPGGAPAPGFGEVDGERLRERLEALCRFRE
jgi:tetratricopeptide (TPR) repeat protein